MAGTDVDKYLVQVLPPEQAPAIFKSLPDTCRPEVFERNLANALMTNPDLMNFPPHLVMREVAKAALLGLLLDPLLGEGYLVTAYNYKSKQTEPQLRVGYKGMMRLVRQTGNVQTVSSHEICANDQVEADFGFPKIFHHRLPEKPFAQRGDVVGYGAVIAFKDGSFDFDLMSVDECRGIRDRSDAYKAFKSGKIKSTPWESDEIEMSKKTLLRRLMKRQDNSTEGMHLVRQAIQIEDQAEHPDMQPTAPATSRVPSAPTRQIAGPPADEPPQKAPEQIEAERQEAFVVARLAEIQPHTTLAELQAWKKKHDPEFAKLTDANFNRIKKPYQDRHKVLKGLEKEPAPGAKKKAAEPAPGKAAPSPQNEEHQEPKRNPQITSGPAAPSIETEYEEYLKWCTARMAEQTDPEILESFFNAMVESNRAQIMPPDFDDLLEAFQINHKRLTTQ